jgi:small-conductance mechanosensitive channel
MKREDLTKIDFTKPDEAIDAIMTLYGKSVTKLQTDLQTAQTEAQTAKDQLTEANKQIGAFKGMKPEDVDRTIGEWKTKAEQAQKDAADQIAALKFDVALKDALKEYKVKDPADVIPHLKRDALKLGDDGKFIGLKEQVDPLKTAKDYLFVPDKEDPKIVLGGNNKSVLSDAVVNAARTAAGLPVAQGK